MAKILIKNGRVWDGERLFRAVTSTPALADEGFSLADAAGHHIESDQGYRCMLTVCDGQIVYRD